MVAAWMLYAAAVAALLAVAAAALDRALRAAGRPTRLAWAAAVAASLLVPAAALWRGAAAPPAAPAEAPGDAADADGALRRLLAMARERALSGTPDAVAPAAWRALDRPLLAAWGAASAAALAWLVLSHRALARRRRAWRDASVGGARVLVSRDVGPAVVGVVGPVERRVVLPAWALALDDARLALMLDHEREHVRARDPLLLAGAAVAAALVPWSPALWWQLRRLRLAVEVDCDRRVLRRHPDVRAYGGLLLDVARLADPDRRVPRLAAAALVSPVTSLERRIRIMTSRRTRRALAQGVALTAAAAALVAVACETPRPTAPRPVARAPLAKITAATPAADGVTPVDEATVRAALARLHPEVLRLSTGKQVRVWFVADADGRVVNSARMADGEPNGGAASLQSVEPSSVKSVEILKLPAGRVAPDSVAVIWVRLRAPGDRGGDVTVDTDRMRLSAERPSRGDVAAGQVAVEGRGASPEPAGRLRVRSAAAAPGASAAPQPLYVLDGREIPADDASRVVQALDPKQIESIDVLKGEAARAAHGEKGRDGVVRIRTKSGAQQRAPAGGH